MAVNYEQIAKWLDGKDVEHSNDYYIGLFQHNLIVNLMDLAYSRVLYEIKYSDKTRNTKFNSFINYKLHNDESGWFHIAYLVGLRRLIEESKTKDKTIRASQVSLRRISGYMKNTDLSVYQHKLVEVHDNSVHGHREKALITDFYTRSNDIGNKIHSRLHNIKTIISEAESKVIHLDEREDTVSESSVPTLAELDSIVADLITVAAYYMYIFVGVRISSEAVDEVIDRYEESDEIIKKMSAQDLEVKKRFIKKYYCDNWDNFPQNIKTIIT